MATRRYIHPKAVVETKHVGAGTTVWEFVHVLANAKIGRNCNVNSHVFIENDVIVGDEVTVKCGVYLWDGIRLEDQVFVGPNVTFTNDRFPRSRQPVEPLRTIVQQGASIGAACVIGPGITIGRYAMIGMGSLVTHDVPDYALMYGQPLRRHGWVCSCGARVRTKPRTRTCRHK